MIYFFESHYEKVRSFRRKNGYLDCHQKDMKQDSLVGRIIYNIETNKEYVIERDWLEWTSIGIGWVRRLLISHYGSHATLFYENRTNIDPYILNLIKKNKNKFCLKEENKPNS